MGDLLFGVGLDGEAEMPAAGVGGPGGVGTVNFTFDRVQVLGAAGSRGRSARASGRRRTSRPGSSVSIMCAMARPRARLARPRTSASSLATRVPAGNETRRGGRLFQADLLALEGGELSLDARGYGEHVQVAVFFTVPCAAQALVTEGPAFARAGNPEGSTGGVLGIFDGEVARLSCHAVDAAVRVVVQYQRAADALPEHREQNDVGLLAGSSESAP